jgi:hypothetical protein
VRARDNVQDDPSTLDALDHLIASKDVELGTNRPFDGDLTASSDTSRHGDGTIRDVDRRLK